MALNEENREVGSTTKEMMDEFQKRMRRIKAYTKTRKIRRSFQRGKLHSKTRS
jgi:hypothetical protein